MIERGGIVRDGDKSLMLVGLFVAVGVGDVVKAEVRGNT